MKKLMLVLTIFILALVSMPLLGCMFFKSNADAATENLERLINCLDTNDRAGVKQLFAPNKIKGIDNFDDDIDELLACYDGKFVSHDFDTPATFDDVDGKVQKKWFIIRADVTTDEGIYHIAMYWCDQDTSNKDNIGIWSLFVFNKADNPLDDFSFYPDGTWENWSGITVVKPYKYASMIINIVADGNVDNVKKLFAPSVAADLSNDDINTLLSSFDGEMTSCRIISFDVQTKTDTNGNIVKAYGILSAQIVTSDGEYLLDVKYSDKDLSASDNIGALSISIR